MNITTTGGTPLARLWHPQNTKDKPQSFRMSRNDETWHPQENLQAAGCTAKSAQHCWHLPRLIEHHTDHMHERTRAFIANQAVLPGDKHFQAQPAAETCQTEPRCSIFAATRHSTTTSSVNSITTAPSRQFPGWCLQQLLLPYVKKTPQTEAGHEVKRLTTSLQQRRISCLAHLAAAAL